MQADQAGQSATQSGIADKTQITKRFSDFASEQGPLEGAKVQLNKILNTEILVTGYRIQSSKFKKEGKSDRCLTVQFIQDNEIFVFFTGSEVLASQIEKYADELPFWTVIKKIDKYYTLS